MKIFVTGGTGFIGKPTVAVLRGRGHDLLPLSRSGAAGGLEGDLGNPEKWIQDVKAYTPDVVLHLAWDGFPKFDMPTTAKNISWALNFFRLLVDIGVPKVVTISSGIEYEGMIGKADESAPFPRPEAEEKHGLLREGRIFLARCMDRFSAETPTKFIRALPFLVYGPGQRPSSLLPSLIRQLADGNPIEIKNPSLAHDFIYVGDVAEAIASLLEKSVAPGRYNASSGRLTSVAELANTALRLFDKPAQFEEPREVSGVYADIRKIQSATGWEPKTTIEEGITRMIQSL